MNDGRATSICNLGPLISAEVAAVDSLQENGLVKYKGNAELSGLFRPALGTVVTFEYTMDGVTRQVPKKMRVLSAFANPLTRTTSVELGCLLTYKSDLREPEKIDTELANRDYTGQLEWSNRPELGAAFPDSWGNESVTGTYWSSGYRRAGASISAKWAVRYCLEKLGITALSIPLTNKFRIQEFDFSAGWVQVISDLLQSEGYVGELDYNEVLQVRSLSDETGTGPVVTRADMQSVSPINSGDIPASALGVEYKVWRFNNTPDPGQTNYSIGSSGLSEATITPEDAAGWEFTQESSQAIAAVRWESTSGATQIYSRSCTVQTVTKTEYTTIGGKRYPIRSTEIKTSPVSLEAPEYAAAQLKAGGFSDGDLQSIERTNYEYNEKGEKRTEIKERFASRIAVAGATNIDFWFPDGVVAVGSGLIPVDKVQVDYYQAGDTERQVTTKWQGWLYTQAGQQAAAGSNKRTTTKVQAEQFLNIVLTGQLYLISQASDSTRRTVSGGDQSVDSFGYTDAANSRLSGISYTYQSRPPDSSSAPVEESTSITWIYGDAEEERRTTLTMPFNDDDQVLPIGGSSWVIVRSTAGEKANRYGRIQNRLTYGYRNGMEIQMNPMKMPDHAFAPLYISIDGLVAQYRVNNPSWVLTAGEAVASCNAIYWGVVGTT
jgi:hypothetical protein